MRNLKLRGKFVVGLSIMTCILVIAVIYSNVSLNGVKNDFENLEKEYLHEVEVGSEIYSSVSSVWAMMTKYGVTGDPELLVEGRKRITSLFEAIDKGEALIANATVDMSLLQSELASMKTALSEYLDQINRTEETFATISEATSKAEMDADLFMEKAIEYQEIQLDSIEEKLLLADSDGEVVSILTKVHLIDDVIRKGDNLRSANLLAQAKDDFSYIENYETTTGEMLSLINQIEAVETKSTSMTLLTQAEEAISEFGVEVASIINANGMIDQLRGQREVTLTKVIDSAQRITDTNLEETDKIASVSVGKLNSTINVILVIFIFGLIVGFAVNMLIVNGIVSKVKNLNQAANSLSLGNVDVQVDASGRDELAELGKSFNNMINGVRKQAEAAEQIAIGNIDIDIEIRSEDDILNIKMKEMAEIIQGLLLEMDALVDRVSIGFFDSRASEERYEGGWGGQLVSGVNGIMNVIGEFFDKMPILLMFADKDFNVRYMNETAATIVGSTKSKVVDKKCFALFNTDQCNTQECASGACMRAQSTQTAETQAHIDGQDIDIKYSGTPLYNRVGELDGFMEIVVDQTDVMNAQRRAKKQALYQDNEVAKLQIDLENLAQGVLEVNARTLMPMRIHKNYQACLEKSMEVLMKVFQALSLILLKCLRSLERCQKAIFG